MKPGIILGIVFILAGILASKYPQCINIYSKVDKEKVDKEKLTATCKRWAVIPGILLIMSSFLFGYIQINENIEIIITIILFLIFYMLLIVKISILPHK